MLPLAVDAELCVGEEGEDLLEVAFNDAPGLVARVVVPQHGKERQHVSGGYFP